MLLLLKALVFVLGHIPRIIMLPLAGSLGALAYRLAKKRAGVARENIRNAYPEKSPGEVDRIAAKGFENIAVVIFDFFRIPWLDDRSLERLVEFEGVENFDRAIKKGKGVILLTAHFGNWEMMAAAVGRFLHPVDIVARELDSPVVDELVNWVRTRGGNGIISKERAMRKLLKSLSGNGVVGILLDQNVQLADSVFVDFFGTLAATNKGPARLAAATGAAVVPIFNVRKGGRYRITVGEEIEMADTGDKEKDTEANTEQCTKAIEEAVRANPDQWFWVHRRWKTRPPGEQRPG